MADVRFQLAHEKPRFFKSKPNHKDKDAPRGILKAPGEYEVGHRSEVPLSASNRHHDSRHGSRYPPSTAIPSPTGVIPYHSLLTPHFDYSSSSSDRSTEAAIRLNSFLSDPRFTWNITLPSTTATYPSRIPNLQLPATDPPTHKLTLRFSLPHPDFSEMKRSWSSLTVRARDSKRVTIRDILDATYSYFQTTLKFHEYNNLPLDAYHDLMESYTRRLDCQKHGSYLGQDPKREDALLGNTSFHGLKLSSVKDGEIKFSLLLGPSIY
jgi:hypothetical protein